MRALSVTLMLAVAAVLMAGCNNNTKKDEVLQPVPEGSSVALPPVTPKGIDVLPPPPPPPPSKGREVLPPPPPPPTKGKMTTPPTKGKTTPPAGAVTHTVKAGDTLSGIAKKYYGDATLWKKIAAANKDKVKDTDKIIIGSVLSIPPK
jgi:nucleoid-associated protein YgaU